MSKRNPYTGTNGVVQTFQQAQQRLMQPPPHITLRPEDWPHWEAVTTAKRADSWTTADLEIAAQLARTLADIPRLRAEIDKQGDTIVQPGTGNTVVNPLHKVLDNAVKRSVTLTRLLQIHSLATQGRSADQAGRNSAARDAADTSDALEEDDLIAKPVKGGRH